MSSKENILEKWFIAKEDLKKLTKKCDTYRDKVKKIMNEKKTHTLEKGGYKVVRKTTKRETVNKKSIPREMWSNYCTTTKFETYNLTKK